jgi:hypothetical protein
MTTEGKEIVLEHRGGEDLGLDTKIMFIIAGKQIIKTVGELLDDESKADGQWNIGEKLVYDDMDITGLQVEATVIDDQSQAVVMSGVIQEGLVYEFPYVETRDAEDIKTRSAKLMMFFNLRNYTGSVRFSYRPEGGSWTNTSWVVMVGNGTYGEIITNLIPKTLYYFKAEMQSPGGNGTGETMTFTTWSIVVGMWHFDEGSGNVAYDSSGQGNDGIVYGAAWVPGVNNTGLEYDGIDDYVRVDDSVSLDFTDEITIMGWMKPRAYSEGYIGNIQSNIDQSEFGSWDCYDPDIINVSSNVYAIVFRGSGNDGYIVTMRIQNTGEIIHTFIDTFEFETSMCYEPKIIHIHDNVFAIVYRGPGDDGYVKTVTIAQDGVITKSVNDTYEYDTSFGVRPDIIHVNGSIYAIVFRGPGDDGYVKTLTIADDGQITSSIIDTLMYDGAPIGIVDEPEIIHIQGTVYAIAYSNPDGDGLLRTIRIYNDGQINNTVIDSYAFDIFDGFEPEIMHISGDVYALFYGGFNALGWIQTVKIASDGTITSSPLDTLLFDGSWGREPSIQHINGAIYAVAYRGPGNDGYVKTVEIFDNGTITQSVIDSLEFDTSNGYDPILIPVFGDIYAIAYWGDYNDGLLRTVRIANNGTITNQVVDASEYSHFDCWEPRIIHVSGDIYALAFRGHNSDGFIRTIEIRSDGSINNSIIDTLEFDTDFGFEPHIIHASGDVYAVAYSGTNWHGYIKTVEIASNGSIKDSVLDTLEFDVSYGVRPDLIHVTGDYYAIAYRGPGDDGFVKTVTIDTMGQISDSIINSLEFDASFGLYPDIFHVNGSVYAIAYTGSDWDGFVKTITIDNIGQITGGVIDSLEFDNSYGIEFSVLNVNGTVFAIAYAGPGYDGFVKTVSIAANGTINGILDVLEFDTSYGRNPDIIHINGRVYAVTYTGPGYDGYIKTFRIADSGDITDGIDDWYEFETWDIWDSADIIHVDGSIFAIAYRYRYEPCGYVKTLRIDIEGRTREIIFKNGAYGIKANSTRVFAYINSQVLSAPISKGYNQVVLTYDNDAGSQQMKLYINGTLRDNLDYSSLINTNSNNVIFGKCNSIIDEVTVYTVALDVAKIVQSYNDLKP